MTWLQNGNVGIGVSEPDHDFEIGTGTYSEINAGEAQFTTSSSLVYKENYRFLPYQPVSEVSQYRSSAGKTKQLSVDR